jgi:hypothetical protein
MDLRDGKPRESTQAAAAAKKNGPGPLCDAAAFNEKATGLNKIHLALPIGGASQPNRWELARAPQIASCPI